MAFAIAHIAATTTVDSFRVSANILRFENFVNDLIDVDVRACRVDLFAQKISERSAYDTQLALYNSEFASEYAILETERDAYIVAKQAYDDV
jgi:hypothetical protein